MRAHAAGDNLKGNEVWSGRHEALFFVSVNPTTKQFRITGQQVVEAFMVLPDMPYKIQFIQSF